MQIFFRKAINIKYAKKTNRLGEKVITKYYSYKFYN